VEQQKAMVKTAERQLTLDIEVRDEQNRLLVSRELPFFQIIRRGGSSGGGSGWRFDFMVRNVGASAMDVLIQVMGPSIAAQQFPVPYIEANHSYEFTIQSIGSTRLSHDGAVQVRVSSKNVRGVPRLQVFELYDDKEPNMKLCDPPQV
jgi:hypothetical protein